MNDSQNKNSKGQMGLAYQYTRAIRFKLNPYNDALHEEIKHLQNQKDSIDEICQLHSLLENLTICLKKYLYKENQETNKEKKQDQDNKFFKDSLEVKVRFLKDTGQYYDWIQQQTSQNLKVCKLYQFGYAYEIFNNFFQRWEPLTLRLDELIQKFQNTNEPEKKPRRVEFALLISELKKRENFPFIKKFIELSQDKSTDEIKDQLQEISKKLSESLDRCEKNYLPSQISGLAIARASLNYYTINRKPKNYPKEIETKENELKKHIDKEPKTICQKIKANQSFKNIVHEFVVKRIFKNGDELITLDSLYKKIKEYKANEKSKFKEAIDQNLKFDDIKNNHPLFECKQEEFNKYVEQTNKIKNLSDQINKLDKQSHQYYEKRKKFKEQITKTKQKRGKDFFQYRNGPYKQLCDFYKHIAMKRGKILAQIKGLDREKIDSQLLKYWALIVEKQGHHHLMLIPKDQAKQAYFKIKEKEYKHSDNDTIKIHYFKSLILRALKKLCFGIDGNTFAKEVHAELKDKYPNQYDDIKGAFSLKDFEDKDTVKFYQTILKTNYVKENLDIQDFEKLEDLVRNTSIESLEEFQIELEKICYIKHILAGEELEKYLLNECQAHLLKITSYDLNRSTECKGQDKHHTKVWKSFWSSENKNQNYSVRLNPDLRVYWRDAKESRVKKYGKESNLYDPSKNNRFLHPQFTLVTTITQNAMGKRTDLAFINQGELAKGIDKFNQTFNKTHAKNPHQTYFYGIDRGNSELATLMICKFYQENDDSIKLALDNPKFNVYCLRKEYLDLDYERAYKDNKKKVIRNLSYFIDNDDLFEKKETSSIDLTTAKLINGKIVENGDILSYLKLKELNAKRRLYENLNNIDRDKQSSIYFKEDKKAFCLHTKNHDLEIYFYRPDLEKVKSKLEIEKMLNEYLKELKPQNQERDILTIEKINHLRDAIASNMIGIINYLYEKQKGIIALENLPENDINKHFMKSNENISRRLEWRLYNKFQTQCLVPPQIKETILLRQTKGINQFGLIHFVSAEHTSQMCPKCEKIATCTYKDEKIIDEKYLNRFKNDLSEKEKNDIKQANKELKEIYNNNKFQEKSRFDCPHCDFDTSIESVINTSDTVASFNIAKRAYKHVLNSTSQHKEQDINIPLQRNGKHNGQNKKQGYRGKDHQSRSKAHNKKNGHSTHYHQTKSQQDKSLTSKPFQVLGTLIKNQDNSSNLNHKIKGKG